VNFKGVGREAAVLLDRLMAGGKADCPVARVAPAGVVARSSTATFVTDSPGITAAMVYLRENFHQALQLSQLARRAGMSDRVFQSEFKRRVGHSAREELHRVRLACAERLLRETDLKLEAIAAQSGFGSSAQLCRFFARDRGASPNAWRAGSKGSH
jgi:LacI family transcriptional regulator